MFTRVAVLALAMAVSHALPQHFGGAYAVPLLPKVAALPLAQKVAVSPVVAKAVPLEHYAPPHYQYEYAVNDQHTGDVKSHHEERVGDHTRGYYTVHQPDGTIMTVHYTVDGDSGFNAVVERTGHAVHPQHAVPLRKVY